MKIKCDSLNICDALEERLEGPNYETIKGLCTITVINIKAGTTSLFGVAYKRNKRDMGLMINFCPFCGGHPGTYRPEE